jgi:hypothetical protein
VAIDGVWNTDLDLLTTCTHHSELQIITARTLSSTIDKSLAHAKPSKSLLDVSWQRFLTVQIHQLPAFRSSCYSLPCRTQPNSLNYSTISSQPPLQSSTELPTLNRQLTTELVYLIVFKIPSCRRPHRKHSSSIVACVVISAGMRLPSRCS